MKQTLEWFQEKERDSVVMITPDGKEVPVTIDDKKDCDYYYDRLQNKGFTFREKIKVHRAPPASCDSCEG